MTLSDTSLRDKVVSKLKNDPEARFDTSVRDLVDSKNLDTSQSIQPLADVPSFRDQWYYIAEAIVEEIRHDVIAAHGGGQSIAASTSEVMGLNTDRIIDGVYTRTAGEVTVAHGGGRVQVGAGASMGASSGDREVKMQLQKDEGGGWSTVLGAVAVGSLTAGLSTSLALSRTVLDIPDGTIIRVLVEELSGNGSIHILPDTASLTITTQ
ncbi:MAG: hypothetical protein ABEN55_19685 [Bradymonadaceae bacterium]